MVNESLNTDFYLDDVSFTAYSGSLGNVPSDAIADVESGNGTTDLR